jgi:hypothetical protein
LETKHLKSHVPNARWQIMYARLLKAVKFGIQVVR